MALVKVSIPGAIEFCIAKEWFYKNKNIETEGPDLKGKKVTPASYRVFPWRGKKMVKMKRTWKRIC